MGSEVEEVLQEEIFGGGGGGGDGQFPLLLSLDNNVLAIATTKTRVVEAFRETGSELPCATL